MNKSHPIQPLIEDDHGTIRFKKNEIVSYLLDNGGIDMNDIAMRDFSQEDREQFAQLIGYSHSGSGDLSYISDEIWSAANEMYEKGLTENEARIEYLQTVLSDATKGIKAAALAVFRIHEDDLK